MTGGDGERGEQIPAAFAKAAGDARLTAEAALAAIKTLAPTALAEPLLTAEAASELFRLEQRFRDQIVASALAELRASRELRRFRAANRLAREARYRPSALPQIGLIAITLVFEAGLNGVLFQSANSLGFLGGAAQAAIFALVNVATGLTLGAIGWRLAGHVLWSPRLLGWALTGLGTAFGLFWNLYVAHFRATLETRIAHGHGHTLGGAPADALEHLFLAPLALKGDESLALLAIGLMVFGFAALEGRSGLADPYWGYKARDEALSDARAEHAAMKDRYRRALARAVAGREAVIDQKLATDLRLLAAMRRIESRAGLKLHRLIEHARRVRGAADAPAPGFPDRLALAAAIEAAESVMIANRAHAASAKTAMTDLARAAENGLESLIAAAESQARQALAEEWKDFDGLTPRAGPETPRHPGLADEDEALVDA